MRRVVILLICISLLGIGSVGCSSSAMGGFTNDYDLGKINDGFVVANNGFAFDVFRKLYEEDLGTNVFISFSISTALMTYNGAQPRQNKPWLKHWVTTGHILKSE